MKKKQICLTLDKELIDAMKRYSMVQGGLSVSFCVNEVLSNFLNSPASNDLLAPHRARLRDNPGDRALKKTLDETFG